MSVKIAASICLSESANAGAHQNVGRNIALRSFVPLANSGAKAENPKQFWSNAVSDATKPFQNNTTPAERVETLINDKSVQRQQKDAATFLSHTHNDEGGRFAKPMNVVGATPVPQYPMQPQGSFSNQAAVVGFEPPYDGDMSTPIVGESFEVQESIERLEHAEPTASFSLDASPACGAGAAPSPSVTTSSAPANPIPMPKPRRPLMARCTTATQITDPITGVPRIFVDPRDGGKWVAEIYLHLALKYHVTFSEIFRMSMVATHGPEAWEEGWDERTLAKTMRNLTWQMEDDQQLMDKFALPLEEYVRIWLRARDGLLRYANFYPFQRPKVEAFLAKREAKMLALVERAQKRQSPDDIALLKVLERHSHVS